MTVPSANDRRLGVTGQPEHSLADHSELYLGGTAVVVIARDETTARS
jgi:hypothetical protein